MAWWRRATDPANLQDDSRRRARYWLIAAFGIVYFVKFLPQLLPKSSKFEVAVHLFNVCFLEVLACLAYSRPGSLMIDVAFASITYWSFLAVSNFYKDATHMGPLLVGSEMITGFACTQHTLISAGTNQLVALVWFLAIWSTCWMSSEVTMHHSIAVLAVQAHVVHFIFLREEGEKRAEISEKRKLELKEAKAERNRWRVETSLNLVLQQLKSPLLLLVSDIKNADASPELAQATLRMLAARVGQIWNLFTGVELKVNTAIKGLAKGPSTPSDSEQETATMRMCSGSGGQGLPQTATAFSAAEGGEDAGLAPAPAPRSRCSARSYSYAASSRSSGSARRSATRVPVPAIAKIRVVFDALHPRAEMKELTISFPENKERVGLLDWVKGEHLRDFKDWLQELTNEEVRRQTSGEPPQPLEATTKSVSFDLPGGGGAASAEAAEVVVRSLVCAFQQPDAASSGAGAGAASGSDGERDGGAGRGAEEGSGRGGRRADGSGADSDGGDSRGAEAGSNRGGRRADGSGADGNGGDSRGDKAASSREEEEQEEEEESSESSEEEGPGELEGVVGVVELGGITLLLGREGRRASPQPSTLGAIGEAEEEKA